MNQGKENYGWQTNPDILQSSTIQVWTDGGSMLTAQCPLKEARQMVTDKKVFVISSQAIGYYEE